MKVLLVVIDAATPRVVCPAIQTGQLPNLKRLADAGEMHQSSVTIFPSITPAATTSIITGAYPKEHGIAGAAWFDEGRQEIAYYGDDFWLIAKQGFGTFLRDFLVRLNGDRLTAPTLFELVERTGRRAACLNYLVYRGLVRHRVNVPFLMTILPGVPFTETVDGPSTLCLGDFVKTPALRGRKLAHKGGLLHRFGMDDESTATVLRQMVADKTLPDFTVAYFADNDYCGHKVGPHAALLILRHVDRAFGRIFDAAGGFDRFLEDTCVIVTSDHGHCEVVPERKKASIRLDRVLSEFRQADLGRAWHARDEIMICPNMRAAQIYAREPSGMLIHRIAHAALREPRIDLVVWRSAITGPGSPTYAVLGPRGRLEFWRENEARARDAFGTAWGWRGDRSALLLDTSDGHVESCEYPNAFERLAGVLDAPNSGEVWMTAAPGCEFEVPGGEAHHGGASHGALHALDSFSPVIVANPPPGLRLPRHMRSVDIAPLCMQVLGLPIRYRVGDPRT